MFVRSCLRLSVLALFISGCGMTLGHAAEPLIPPVLLQMCRDSLIHDELGLTAQQRASVLSATDTVDTVYWPSRILPADQQIQIQDKLTSQLWAQLITILDAEQRERLTQLRRQAAGTRMLLLNDVADALKLSNAVRSKLKDIALQTDEQVIVQQKKLTDGGDRTEIAKELEKLKDRERKAIVEVLTPAQQQQIGQLVGLPFDFSKVQRTHPRAPELIASTEHWLAGKPLKMSDLRGKVVVLHFYAFQCINCQRNLPHYNGWSKDFSSDDVVIIGIQTPETSAERDAAKVAAAIKKEGIDYHVLFDENSENWKAWGNTMWPTVYLIDRDGFIRTWWQGELNWQGAKGEQQYREYIRKLVNERNATL